MGEHVILNVDELGLAISVEPSESFRSLAPREASCSFAPSVPSSVEVTSGGASREEENAVVEEEEPLIQTVECRICQEEDHINNLDTPCACNGTLKYAHRTCVQRWCNEKGDRTCEICLKLYKPGFIVAPRSNPDETGIALSAGWALDGTPVDHREPILGLPAQQHALEVEIEEYANANALVAAFYRCAALIVMFLVLLRYVVAITDGDGDNEFSALLSLFLLKTPRIPTASLRRDLGIHHFKPRIGAGTSPYVSVGSTTPYSATSSRQIAPRNRLLISNSTAKRALVNLA